MSALEPGKLGLEHPSLQKWFWEIEPLDDAAPEVAFTDNETNLAKCFGGTNVGKFFKDGINDYVVSGDQETINPKKEGTKAAAIYTMTVPAGKSLTVRMRLYDANEAPEA